MGSIQNMMDRISQIQSKFHQFRVFSKNSLVEKKIPQTNFKEKLENELDKKVLATNNNSSDINKINNQIELAAKKYAVPEHLIDAIIKNESNYNHLAISPKGAQGLMQLMPKTAKELGVTNPFNISENIDGGTKYLSQLLNRYDGDFVKAISAYNAGPAQVVDGVPNFKETKSYVKKVVTAYLKNLGVD